SEAGLRKMRGFMILRAASRHMTFDSPVPADLLDNLAARLGREHVLTAPTDIAPHLAEGRGLYRGTTAAVVRPHDTEEVAAVVRECARRRVAIVPHGGNTGLVGGG